MKTKLFLSLVVSGLISASLVSTTANAGFFNQSNKPGQASQQSQAQRDGEIIAILVGLNKNEIAAAKEASQKSHNPAVRNYARMLKIDHSKNLKDTLRLSKKTGITPVETNAVMSLKKDGEQELVVLTPLTATEFDRAFIDAMIKDHINAIQLIDTNLLVNVSNPKLKKQIEMTRPHLEAHLNQAKAIQDKIG